MVTATPQRLGVCCRCQSSAPVVHHSLDEDDERNCLGDEWEFDPGWDVVRGFVMAEHRVGGGEVGEWCSGVGTFPQALIRTYLEKIEQTTDEDLRTIWSALGKIDWGKEDMYDQKAGVTWNEWAMAIDGEMTRRGLPHEF